MEAKKRRICFVITSKIHYGRSKIILEELKKRDDVELKIIVGASAILPNYGDVITLMNEDGFVCDEKITMTLEGGNPVAMAKTAGIGVIEFTTVFDNLKPDIVLLRGDRYEVLSAAIAAAYLNIPIAHIEGGDVTGTIDESVRHAITKLAHIHFTTNEKAKQRVLKMGEDPDYVFDFGSPDLEFVARNSYSISNDLINKLGVGDIVDINKPYLILMQHPVTSEIDQNRKNIDTTLETLKDLGIPTICFWPNDDAGTNEVAKGIRVFRENKNPKHMRFTKYLGPEEFIGLLKNTVCLVGNSSAGIKECSYLGVPVVNIGTRQNGRLQAENVTNVNYDQEEIKNAILNQIKHGKYPSSSIYHKPDTAKNITETLAKIKLYWQKKFKD
ncbi:MAG: UDP-N-acetylglucosamine 2-epimerase [Patescibacteria group bacterium]